MARKVRDKDLTTRTARLKLKARGKPYYRNIRSGLDLGYRKLTGKRDGTWTARRYLGAHAHETKRISSADDCSDANGVSVLTYDQAVDACRAWQDECTQVAAGKPTGLYTVDDTFSRYETLLERAGRISAATNARSKYEASIKPKLGKKEAGKITTEQFEDWRDGIVKAPRRLRTKSGEPPKFRKPDISPEGLRRRQASANRVWTTLKAALNVSFRDGRIASDAAWKRVKAFHAVDGVRLDYLAIAETARINNAADQEFRPLLQAGLLTGGRYGSIAELTVGDFNPDAGTVAFRTRKGKGTVKVYHCHLTPEGVAFFKAACARRAGTSALIFTHTDGRPWKAGDQLRPMKEAVERARIGRSITFYHLRHTWASHAVMNGTPLMVVAQNLGHSDTRMVERHYGHLAPGYRKQEILKGAPVFGIKPDIAVL